MLAGWFFFLRFPLLPWTYQIGVYRCLPEFSPPLYAFGYPVASSYTLFLALHASVSPLKRICFAPGGSHTPALLPSDGYPSDTFDESIPLIPHVGLFFDDGDIWDLRSLFFSVRQAPRRSGSSIISPSLLPLFRDEGIGFPVLPFFSVLRDKF